MTSLVLVGGMGTRLRPLLQDLPKPLAPVGNRPFLEYLVLQLHAQGFKDIIFCTGYGAKEIAECFGDGHRWGVHLRYSHEVAPLGTAGAIKQAARLKGEGPFLVMNGDSFLEADLHALLNQHFARGGVGMLALAQAGDSGRFGRVEVDTAGRITRFVEKGVPRPGLINGGIYVFDPAVLRAIPDEKSMSLECELLPRLLEDGLYGMTTRGFFIDIGLPEDYRRLAENPEILLRRLATTGTRK